MITELIVANCMIGLFILGLTWNSKDLANIIVKVWVTVTATSMLLLLLKLEGYITKR